MSKFNFANPGNVVRVVEPQVSGTWLLGFLVAATTLTPAWLWIGSSRAGAQTPTRAGIQETQHSGNGLSDYAMRHKYLIEPQKTTAVESPGSENDWNQRKEFTYTITAVLRIAKPFNIADMNDDYQDARVLSEDQDTMTVEVVYYPLNTNKEAIGENPNWRHDDAGMTQYLQPTVTENWDDKMRADLIAELKKDGIDPDKLTDKQLVTQVSLWVMRRSRSTKPFAAWYVYYPDGRPEVFPALRPYFNKEKTSPDSSDQAVFEEEVLGRSMFYNRTHGSCTPSAVLMATVMRALGIPTRILFFIPPLDNNDRRQREMFLANIHDNAVRSEIRHGLPGGNGNFSNHLFNEVFVGHRWVRLNYDALGQNTLDGRFLGLMTHILTTDSLSHVPLAETWGSRLARYPDSGPKLSSINPYQLLRVSDHFGVYSHIANPDVEDEELRNVTVVEAFWKGSLPAVVSEPLSKDPNGSDFYIGIKEFIPGFQWQQRDFVGHAGNHFVLVAENRPELKATLSGMKYATGHGSRPYSLFGVRVDPEYRQLEVPGVKYTIHPINTNDRYTWTVKDGVFLESGSLERP